MVKKILVFNVGSSSIKYSLFENKKKVYGNCFEKLNSKEDFKEAIHKIFEKFKDTKIDLIAHRVVHGGPLDKPSRINTEVIRQIEKYSEFAPLHNPKQLMAIRFAKQKTKIPQYAVFDTMFFSELPEVSRNYGIPKSIVKKYGIKRYGFHGLSHKFVSKELKGKTITCHLGSGSSIAAIKDKKPLDTSMGLTPLEGVMMGTRSGSIDPGIILFLQQKGYNAEKILTEKSGLKGICGYNDFRDILKKMGKDKNCKLAYNLYQYRIIKVVGSYIPVLEGIDNLVFTAAIGQNVPKLRESICKHFEYLGMKIDKKRNNKNEELISSKNSKIKVYVKKTNEEKQIVEEVLKVI